MNWQFKQNAHVPIHLLADKQLYFVTGRTLYGKNYLRKNEAKEAFKLIMEDFLTRRGWRLDHWVILDNHYHFTADSELGKDLQLIIGNIHRKSGKEIREHTDIPVVRKIWHNYWDRCVRDEEQYLNCLSYMYWNPVKHGYVTDPMKYSWSSFSLLSKNGTDVESLSFLNDRIDKLPFLPGDFE